MSIPRDVELLVKARWVLPIVPRQQLFEQAALAIDGEGRIVALLPQEAACEEFRPKNIVDLPHHLLMPGLVNAWADTLSSLPSRAAPEAARVEDSTALAIARMIRSGTTTFSAMGLFPEAIVSAAQQAGIRAQIAFPLPEAANPWSSSDEAALSRGLKLHDSYRFNSRISIGFGISDKGTSTWMLQRIAPLVQELDAALLACLEDPLGVSRLAGHNLLSPLTRLTGLQALNAEALARADAHGCHPVFSLADLARGQTAALLTGRCAQGRNGALGSGTLPHHPHNLFAGVNLLSLSGIADLDPRSILGMATLGGATALGLEDRTGSLEPGKMADLIALDLDDISLQPLTDPVAQLVSGNGGQRVSHVWVEGKPLLQKGVLQSLNEREVVAKARAWQQNPLQPF